MLLFFNGELGIEFVLLKQSVLLPLLYSLSLEEEENLDAVAVVVVEGNLLQFLCKSTSFIIASLINILLLIFLFTLFSSLFMLLELELEFRFNLYFLKSAWSTVAL